MGFRVSAQASILFKAHGVFWVRRTDDSLPPLQGQPVYQESDGHAGESNTTLIPPIHLDIGGVEDVLAEDHGVASRPAEQNHIAGVETRSQELRLPIHVLQVVLLPAILGDRGAELEIDRRPSGRDQHARDPYEQGKPHAAG